jgi:hypothetical protein
VASQLLAGTKRRSVVEVVRHLLAVQAQDFANVPLALRARSKGLTRADVHAALDSGDIVISWLNRGTLHMVCREDFGWLHALTTPPIRRSNERWLANQGVTDPERGVKRIVKLLEDGPMLRSLIGERIGVSGQPLTHLLYAATLDGHVMRGPVRGREQTFVLVRDHLGELPPVDREAALRELGRRYQVGHRPAAKADLAYWAGLPLRDIRLEPVPAPRPAVTGPKLLPPFDPYIMGWKARFFAVPAPYEKQVMPGGGMFRGVVLVDGRAVGTWSRPGGRVTVAPFERDIDGLDAEIADVERFLA